MVESLCVDTNVPVYAFDRSQPTKARQAESLLRQVFAAGKPLLSVQVLSEFYWTVTRKLSQPMSHDEAATQVRNLPAMATVVPVSWQVLEKALAIHAAHGSPLWDAQIVAVAALNGATRILSEDFQHRQVMDGIAFLNPFAPDFDVNEVLGP